MSPYAFFSAIGNSVNESDFKSNFISTFLATYCAVNYADFCARGLHKELEHPPVEDAVFLANTAWEEMIRQDLDLK